MNLEVFHENLATNTYADLLLVLWSFHVPIYRVNNLRWLTLNRCKPSINTNILYLSVMHGSIFDVGIHALAAVTFFAFDFSPFDCCIEVHSGSMRYLTEHAIDK